jgi:light-regulated signal transduction histidine kinase (bacteriophytochrome)
MEKNRIQFNLEDVLKIISDWKEKSKEDKDTRNYVGYQVIHSLVSPMFGLRDLSSITLQHDDFEYYKEICIKDQIARAYTHNLHNLGMNYARYCHDLVTEITKTKEEQSKSLKELANDYLKSLELIASYIPLTPIIEKLTTLNEKQRWYCNRADVSSDMVIYIGNRLFSPNFQRDEYHLKQDVDLLYENVKSTFKKEDIYMLYGNLHDIFTVSDYLANAIEPIVFNVRDHAFNPENDINGRMKQEKFYKNFIVHGFPENKIDDEEIKGLKRPADNGNYIVRIQDNGFGIKEEYLPHIFEKGFTTKLDKDIAHGIGLWGVKQFVEKYGGVVSVKTQLGKGTTFDFTIPYTHLNDFVCVQK